jgi:DNA-binding response OmpR family regulator
MVAGTELFAPMPRILLVEDDDLVRLVVEETLLDAGYEVDATGTVADGYSLLDSGVYDLLLTDGSLPDGNGLSIAQRANEMGVRVVIFTGLSGISTYDTDRTS